jgi:uncharacterized protein YndB with AHSA1/START domain
MGGEVWLTQNVPLSPERAFELFTDGFGSWWPREFSWSQDVLEEIAMETAESGLLREIGPHGLRLDWGRVLEWEPPRRLAFSWQISPSRVPEPNPAKASEVEVRFEPDGEGCRMQLVHRGFERHGDGAAEYAEMMEKQGWPLALERFRAAAAAG